MVLNPYPAKSLKWACQFSSLKFFFKILTDSVPKSESMDLPTDQGLQWLERGKPACSRIYIMLAELFKYFDTEIPITMNGLFQIHSMTKVHYIT
jgi:hypothetical protein